MFRRIEDATESLQRSNPALLVFDEIGNVPANSGWYTLREQDFSNGNKTALLVHAGNSFAVYLAEYSKRNNAWRIVEHLANDIEDESLDDAEDRFSLYKDSEGGEPLALGQPFTFEMVAGMCGLDWQDFQNRFTRYCFQHHIVIKDFRPGRLVDDENIDLRLVGLFIAAVVGGEL